MIVLDASVLIAHLDAGNPHHVRAGELLLETGAEPLGSSSITLAETLVSPARTGRMDEALEALDRLGVTELGLGADAPKHLARLRAETGRKLPDCCVLAVALDRRGTVGSLDRQLLKTADDLGLKTIGSEPGEPVR